MLERKRQVNYFRKRWESLFSHLHAFADYGDTEELHRVRMEIKKIKALFSLQKNRVDGKNERKHFKPICKLFDKAGKIRVAQINLELMHRFRITNSPLEKIQTHTLVGESEKLHSKIVRHEKNIRKEYSFFLDQFHNLENERIRKSVGKELKSLAKVFSGNMKVKQLHHSRMKLKNLIYANEICSIRLPDESQLNAVYIRKLEQMIGKWHDTVTAIALFEGNENGKKLMGELKALRKKQLQAIHFLTEDFKNKIVWRKSAE